MLAEQKRRIIQAIKDLGTELHDIYPGNWVEQSEVLSAIEEACKPPFEERRPKQRNPRAGYMPGGESEE